MNQQPVRVEEAQPKAIVPASDADSHGTLGVLEELLIQSIHVRDLYRNARWQISGSEFPELRQMLDDHYKEQLSLIGLLLDRIRMLGGAAHVFARVFLQSTGLCR